MEISISPLFVLMIVVLFVLIVRGTKSVNQAFFRIVFLVLLLLTHELAHSLAGRHFGVETVKLGLTFWGAYVLLEPDPLTVSIWSEIVVDLAGPLANLALAGVLTIIPVRSGSWKFARGLAFLLGILNLAPVKFLDGGHALYAILLGLHVDSERAGWIVSIATFVTIFLYFLLPRSKRKEEKGSPNETTGPDST